MRNNLIAASVAALLSVPAAHAGGFVAPVLDAEPAPVVAPAPSDWQGGYAGITLGYAFGGDDDIGVRPPGGDIGSAELSGANAGLRLGYRWQRDRWVVGPEVAYVAGDISDDFDFGVDGEFESEVNNLLGLRLKTGYLVRPDTLVYGIAGWQKGDFTYNVNGTSEDYDADGYVVGLGVERQLTERMSLTGEYEYSDFGSTDVDIVPGATSVATPSFSNVKLGLNFRF